MTELATIAKGKWRDTYVYPDGRFHITPWKANQIQNTQSTLAAILMKGTRSTATPAFSGINWFAVGEGHPDWDFAAPTKAYTQTTLQDELWRAPVDATTQVFYLDPITELVVAGPTRMIQFNLSVPASVVGSLREFGMFGGDATSAVDTGYMVNWIDHDVIPKTADDPFEIIRTLRIKWLTPEEM